MEKGKINLLTEWLKQHPLLKDKKVRIGNMTFHIPFNGTKYLMFKCRRCGWCCNNQKQGALMLTLGDIRRLTRLMGYANMTKFLEAECVWAETTEPKQIYTRMGGSWKVKYEGYYLKRFPGENEATIEKPHRCRFLTKDNLCRIQRDGGEILKPVVCRKFPYIISKDETGLYHAYYADVPWSKCPGYREKKKIQTKFLNSWINPLIDGAEEVYETMKNDLMQITSLENTG